MQLAAKPVIVSTECARRLHDLDTDGDGDVSIEEWKAAETDLPVLYGVLLACFVGIADNARVGQFYTKLSVEEPVKEEPVPVAEPPPSPPRRFTLNDLRNNSTFVSAIAAVDTN